MQFITTIIMMTIFVISTVNASPTVNDISTRDYDVSVDPVYGLPGPPIPVTRVTWDPVYDDRSLPFTHTACGYGNHSLIAHGFNKIGDLPLPVVGGSSFADCGTCWQMFYPGRQDPIYLLVVDTCEEGFNISKDTMSFLTNGTGIAQGVLTDVTVHTVGTALCAIFRDISHW